ncbi:MAG: hypothetical protein GY927_18200 [bacterium]|nr:hypothetical protein [Planctomycetaceae bacterium]MCP4936074.1 hypothetical protein [bacterium]
MADFIKDFTSKPSGPQRAVVELTASTSSKDYYVFSPTKVRENLFQAHHLVPTGVVCEWFEKGERS